jgi:hypothetical protein
MEVLGKDVVGTGALPDCNKNAILPAPVEDFTPMRRPAPPLLRVALPVFGWRAENHAPAAWLGDEGRRLA